MGKKEWIEPEFKSLSIEFTEKGHVQYGKIDHAEWNPDEGRWEVYLS